ncbi:DeoR/GlpR family DNA-binding transcription regulator [Sneathiella chinensis]|uniref:DeoR family transcriptional regulator n=1 Tax=Sneathiella chinensis TaxID=349750 RepID=A0ABQ5TZV4_9PROT|nr:DeoR/GlpR family DNA-binding transcription regulator [Sneathiella chinensis]GLQ05392.1 DeoR family transcriptional regulator [Sneathiella chinensis]
MSGRRQALRPGPRKAAIFEFVERRGKASVEELAEKFSTSPETVRRDLNALAEAGQVRKVHGGVVRITPSDEGSFGERLTRNTLAKQIIADQLARTISPGQSLFMDTGSTTLICAEALSRIKNLTVITNSARIAHVFAAGPGQSDAIMLGGRYRHDNDQTVGSTTIAEVGKFRADHAVLTVGTLDHKGAADFSESEAQVARAMIDAAEQVTVVADSSKLNHRSTFHVCGLDQIDRLILDKTPDPAFLDALNAAGVTVITAQ